MRHTIVFCLIEQDIASVEICNLDDVITQGGKICIMVASAKSFTIRHPVFDPSKLITSPLATDVLQNMDDGKCIAAMLMEDMYVAGSTGWEDADHQKCRGQGRRLRQSL
jgi:hypothetical protein